MQEPNEFEQKLIRIKQSKVWDAFKLTTPEGKVKSTLMIYSFSLSFIFLTIYIVAYWQLITPELERFLARFLTNQLLILAESFLPAFAGTVVCCATWFMCRDKRVFFFGFVWLLLYLVLLGIAAGAVFTADEMAILWMFALRFAVPAVGTGLIVSGGMVLRHQSLHPDYQEEQLPAWKRR